MIALIQTSIFISYLLFIKKKFGILPSISDSWYALGKKGWLFSIFILILAGTTIAYSTAWFFCAGGVLAFVGVATQFRESVTDEAHYIGATGGILLAMAAIGFDWGNWSPLIITVVLGVILKLRNGKNNTWWIEVVAFSAIQLGAFIHILETLI